MVAGPRVAVAYDLTETGDGSGRAIDNFMTYWMLKERCRSDLQVPLT